MAHAKLIPSIRLHIYIPEDLYAKLCLSLYSTIEGRVPKGDLSKFFIERIAEHFAKESK